MSDDRPPVTRFQIDRVKTTNARNVGVANSTPDMNAISVGTMLDGYRRM